MWMYNARSLSTFTSACGMFDKSRAKIWDVRYCQYWQVFADSELNSMILLLLLMCRHSLHECYLMLHMNRLPASACLNFRRVGKRYRIFYFKIILT